MSTYTITINPTSAFTSSTSTQSTSTRSAYIQRPLEISDVRGLVDNLVLELQDSPTFSAHAAGIIQWQTAMNGHDLTTQAGLQRASSSIGFLIHRVIRPALIANRSNHALAMQIGSFEQKCQQILEITCPDAASRQILMNSYLTLARKGAANKEKKEKVINAYAQLEERLNQMTQLNREALREIFEDLKTQLLALNENQTQAAEAIKLQMIELTQKMAVLSEQFSTHAQSAVQVAEDLMAYKTSLLRNLLEMQDIAKRVSS